MADPDPHAPELDEVSSQLTDSLKACRAIVSDYRAMLCGGDDGGVPEQDESFQD